MMLEMIVMITKMIMMTIVVTTITMTMMMVMTTMTMVMTTMRLVMTMTTSGTREVFMLETMTGQFWLARKGTRPDTLSSNWETDR